jgi:hypothetical protein
MADDKNLESKILIAQVVGPILRRVIPRILDGGAAGTSREDERIRNLRRRGEALPRVETDILHPQREINSRPAQSQMQQGNYPAQTTLPQRPGTQPISDPPYQPPVNQPSPKPQPDPNTTAPSVDPDFERERGRLQKEYDAILREIAEQQKKNDRINSNNEATNRRNAERLRWFAAARSRLLRKAYELDQLERNQNNRPNTNRPFDGSGPLTFLNNNLFGDPNSCVLQTNSSSNEISFGDKLTRAMQESLTSGKIKDGFVEEMKKLLTPDNLAMMGGLLAVVGSANLAATAIGGPIGSGITALVEGAIGLAVFGGNLTALAEATGALFGFVTKVYGAKTDADYLEAAKDFAKFVNVVGPNFIANNMTGAVASKALGSISRKLELLGGELGKLSPMRQEQIQSGLRAGRDMLGKLGKDIQGGFKGIFESINNALSHLPGNNPKKLTGNAASPNPGGKNPKKPETTVKLSRWEKESKKIDKELQKRIDRQQGKGTAADEQKGLAINLERLQAKKINPETVTKITEKGLLPGKLNTLLEDIKNFTLLKNTESRGKRSLDPAVKSAEFHELAELINKFLNQISKQSDLTEEARVRAAKDFIQYVVSDRQIYTFAKEILNSGKLSNAEGLGLTVKNFATQPKISSALGYQFETEFAAQLVRSGKKVTMGKGADVVDDTSKQAWQLKNSQEAKSFGEALKKAAEQLTGDNGEHPLLGYFKSIKIRLTNKENPEYLKSPKQLEEIIKKAMGTPADKKWNIVDQVQIIIDNKIHIFDIKKIRGDAVPVPKGTGNYDPYSISELPTETRVAGLQSRAPQLLSAIEKYQQTVKNAPISEQRKERQVDHQVAMAKQSEDVYRRLDQVNQNIQRLNTELAGQTFNLNEISPNILRNANSNDPKAVAYASALLLKNSGRQAFVSKESELELMKINDTGQVTLYSHLLSADTKQNILDAAQQLQQEQTRQAQRSNSNQCEM